MTVAVWFLTRCFIERNPNILNAGDRVLLIGLFLLMLAPSGRALSVDAWLRRRRGRTVGPEWTAPWSVRLFQIQLCLIYLTTGLRKLKGDHWMKGPWREWLHGTWWDGTSIHYVLNDTSLNHWSFVQFPLPLWATAPLTYASAFW